jgi:retron-type reverse transcriptase
MFDKIISPANFELAYLEIIEQFALDRKNFKYHGLDNLLLKDYDLNSRELIDLARTELIAKKAITPALSLKIPKKNNPEKFREIFIYNLKERVKAQAIFRVLSPEFEKNFSNRLFSYRPGKPPYLAAQNFGRRYRRSYGSDQALIIDLENYSDQIDKALLFSQLRDIFADSDVLDVLRLFIYNQVYRAGRIESPEKGLVQGVPLIASFANLYLSDLDFKYQNAVPFYIRVGDDIALLDKFPDKLKKIEAAIRDDLARKKLTINERKLYFGPAKENFSFLGYNFNNGLISLDKSYVNKIEAGWKQVLAYKHLSDRRKDYLLKTIMAEPKNNFNFQFQKLVKDKPQINDSEQIKRLSEDFWRILTRFLYKRYSARNRRLLEGRTKELGIRSLYNYYKQFHYERD